MCEGPVDQILSNAWDCQVLFSSFSYCSRYVLSGFNLFFLMSKNVENLYIHLLAIRLIFLWSARLGTLLKIECLSYYCFVGVLTCSGCDYFVRYVLQIFSPSFMGDTCLIVFVKKFWYSPIYHKLTFKLFNGRSGHTESTHLRQSVFFY